MKYFNANSNRQEPSAGMPTPIRVLIVDDSLIFRKAVETALSGVDGVSIAGSARNGVKAMELIKAAPPDIITLDLEMPEMDGMETLRAMQGFNASRPGEPPVGAIMLSSFTRKGADVTVEALAAGAFDFIAKPELQSQEESLAALKRQLSSKIHAWATQRFPVRTEPDGMTEPARKIKDAPAKAARGSKLSALAIGVSTGGPKALNDMLPGLCEVTDLPILIVQHMPPTFTKSLADQLDKKCSHKVVEATDDEPVRDKHVYIAPGGRHMTLKRAVAGVRISLNEQPPENGCRPSVDVLFRSAAAIYGDSLMAVILTGMGNDGAKATFALKRSGARVIVQDEATSVVWGMPGSAVETGNVDAVRPLMEIPHTIKAALAQE